jgi:hypothetical protein
LPLADSALFRRKQHAQELELELGTRQTELASLAAGDEAAERRLWAKVLDTEDSEEQVPVLESRGALATSIWVIFGKQNWAVQFHMSPLPFWYDGVCLTRPPLFVIACYALLYRLWD